MEVEVAELKLELKQWELNFLKQNNRKPTKIDVAKLPSIQVKYEKFISLKMALKESSVNKENEKNSVNNSEKQRKILSPKNDNCTSDVSSVSGTENSVWGANLLKKNAVKLPPDVAEHDDNVTKSKSKQKSSSPDQTPKNWRENIRKNIGFGSSIKRLPTTLKRRSFAKSNIESSLNATLGLDASINEDFEKEDNNIEEGPENSPLFGSQVKIVKTGLNHSISLPSSSSASPFLQTRSSPFASLFCSNSTKKTTLLSRSNNMDKIEMEDLSDLKNMDQGNESTSHESLCAKSSEVDVGSQHEENIQPFKDETESFLEANFREKAKEKFSFTSDSALEINYESVCLNSDTAEPKVVEKDSESGDLKTDDDTVKSDMSKANNSVSQSSKRKLPQTNFVRLNMKQKCFRKKGGGGNFLRRQVFKQKMAKKGYSGKSGWKGRSGGFKSSGGNSWKGGGDIGYRDRTKDKCYKCGGLGHWASKCTGQGFQKKKKTDLETEQEEKQSLEEVLENIDLITAALKGESSADFLKQKITVSISDPILEKENNAPILDHEDVAAALKMFKYTSFRPGQDKAITRILKGLPTLLVLSTGSGKSLCYQLPAYLYATKKNAITLVISPLVSLMDDQVKGLPRMMKATRIHSGMSKEQRNKAMLEVENGKVHVLLVSPEAITSWAGMSPKYSPLSKLPPIAFACIDECHCLSEWSHAFRPSYLRVCQVLREQLGVKCIVGLTATATMDTCASVAKQLGIADYKEGIIAKIDIPDNLVLSISKDRYKDEALSQLLVGNRFSKLDSVIVYCTRRDEAARIASFLRVKMLDMPALDRNEGEDANEEEGEAPQNGSKKRKRGGNTKTAKKKVVTLDAECYHAGMSASERRRIQNKFMNGSLRVVVATVAFGMGIDKQDVRSVIHYNMPMSFERYVQEIGRAGRDGKPAHCHLFLDADGGDLHELSRHSYGKTMERHVVRKFVKKIFATCQCSEDSDDEDFCRGHFSAIEIDTSIEELDVTREGLETLLCYLEVENLIRVHLPTETKCTMQFYGGPGQMIETAKRVQAVALALKLSGTKSNETKVSFDCMKVADELNMDLPYLKKILRYLTYDTTLSVSASEVGKSGIEVEFSQMSFCVQSTRKASDEFLDAVTDMLCRRVIAQENKEIMQLRTCFNTMQKFACANVGICRDSANESKSTELKGIITEYFRKQQNISDTELDLPSLEPQEEAELRGCVRQFLQVHGNDLDNKVTGRAIARIFHGVDSPRYPARNWGPARRFWRSKLHIDFNVIRKIATEEILGRIRQ